MQLVNKSSAGNADEARWQPPLGSDALEARSRIQAVLSPTQWASWSYLEAILVVDGGEVFEQLEGSQCVRCRGHIDTGIETVNCECLGNFRRICKFNVYSSSTVLRKFLVGRDCCWNLLDISLLLSSVVEIVGPTGEINVSFVRLVRVLRMLRAIQVVRRMTIFRKLRLLLLAMLDSILAVFWAVSALLLITFVFAVLFLQGAAQYLAQASPADSHFTLMATFFCALPMTLLTLWMCVSGGISWLEIEEVWLEVAPGYAVLLVCYQALMTLALLKIVTGIFVNDSIEAAQNDRDLKAIFERERKAHFIHCATRIFEEMVTDSTTILSRKQFEQQFAPLSFHGHGCD